jgi:hypothetical protein
MSEEKGKVVAVTCPCCQSLLWIDASTGGLVKSEKAAAKKKESLDDLLLKEKKKKDGFATKFEETAELEKKKFETAKAKFEKAFEKRDDE